MCRVEIVGIILICLSIGVVSLGLSVAKAQQASTNTMQQTNQIKTSQTRESKIDKAVTIKQARALHKTPPPEFQDYDQKLVSDISQKWHALLDKEKYDDSDNGKLVVAFKLYQDGNVSDIKLSGNTNALAAPCCVQAIKDCSPFPKWPDVMRSIVNTNFREINFTFYLNQQQPKQ